LEVHHDPQNKIDTSQDETCIMLEQFGRGGFSRVYKAQ